MDKTKPDLWFAYVKTHRLMIREIEARFTAAGLPDFAWYDALWGLESSAEGALRMHELADALVIERYSLTRLVDRLEKEKLVVRTRSAEDGRAAFVGITAEGRAMRKKMWRVYEAAVAELFLTQFNESQQRAFSEGLLRAGQAVRELGAG